MNGFLYIYYGCRVIKIIWFNYDFFSGNSYELYLTENTSSTTNLGLMKNGGKMGKKEELYWGDKERIKRSVEIRRKNKNKEVK